MWLSKDIVDFFKISQETVSSLREELAALRTERDSLQTQLRGASITSDWFRMQINTLQMERTALMEKAYGIKIPSPEIVRQPVLGSENRIDDFAFDDIGDAMAKKFGYPTYGDKQ